jgi:hypothetical protein
VACCSEHRNEMDYIQLAQNMVKWRAVLNIVMKVLIL